MVALATGCAALGWSGDFLGLAGAVVAGLLLPVLSLLLERTVEHACSDTWRNVSDRLRRIQLAQLLSPHGTVWQGMHLVNPLEG